MSSDTINLTPKLYEYLLKNSLREPQILQQLRHKTAELSTARMQISPEQGQFMALLVELLGAKKTIDIGTYTGYSALTVALALPADGQVIACDINEEWTAIARHFWQEAGVSAKIHLKLAPALNTLDELIASNEVGTFDFIFIDADKLNYRNYYEKALQLSRPGGLITIDNVLWGGDVADETNQEPSTKAIRALNAALLKDERISLSIVPIGDGLTLARKLI